MIEPFSTTTVGAYSVPPWYEVLEKQVEAGTLSDQDMSDVQFRAGQGAIADQEAAGIDIITTGEMHRRTNNRNAPPNAMLNHFWRQIGGFSDETRPKNITPKDANVTHPAQVLTGPVDTDSVLDLVTEFQTASRFAHRPVKITMTGPHMLAKVAWDEYYNDIGAFMEALAALYNKNFHALQDAGCEHLQIDEPLFAAVDRSEVEAAVEAINLSLEGITMNRWVHICQGNYAVGAHYDGQIGHRYFDHGEYPAEEICQIDCDAIMVEYDYANRYEGHLRNQQLAVGAADVIDRNVESPETIVERVQANTWLAPEQTLLTTSCGLNHLSRATAFAKMQAIHDAAGILKG
jgi:5-methyltetrahydropteroyltriglutamate--homocysteine methyltransferase